MNALGQDAVPETAPGGDAWIARKFQSLGKSGLDESRERSTLRGLGLSGLAMLGQTKFLGEQIVAEPGKAVTGSLDSMLSMGMASPALLTARALAGPRSFASGAPVSDMARRLSPTFYNHRNEAAQRYADETRDELAKLNQRIQADRPRGALAGFTYDLGTAGVQMVPAVGVGLALRSPRLAATAMTLPAAGGLVADGMDKDLGSEGAFRRAAPVVAAQSVLNRPLAALLTLPAKKILSSGALPKGMQSLARSKGGRVGAAMGISATEGAASQSLIEAYDAGVLGEEINLKDALSRIGYAGLIGSTSVLPFSAVRLAVDSRKSKNPPLTAPAVDAPSTDAPVPQSPGQAIEIAGGDQAADLLNQYRAMAIKLTGNSNYISTDLAKELFPEYAASRDSRTRNSMAVQNRASEIKNAAWKDTLAQPVTSETDTVVFMAGGTGAGKTTSAPHAGIVYDGNLASVKSARTGIDAALGSGRKVRIVYVYRDPVDAYLKGVIPRAMSMGRIVPTDIHASTHIGSMITIKALNRRYKGRPDVSIEGNIPEGLPPSYDKLLARLNELVEAEYEHGRISPLIYSQALARGRPQPSLPQND